MKPLYLLYFEDETTVFNLVRAILENTHPDGFLLRRAEHLQQGLAILAEDPPDLILLDLDLPDSRGLETLKQVLARFPHLPIVVLTGIGDEEIAGQVLDLGAQDFLEKIDLKPKTLIRSLRYAGERKRDREAREALEESEKKLKALLHNLMAGVFLIDAETHVIVEVNDQAVKMTGASREQLLGKDCHQFVCPAEIGQCPVTDLNQTVDHSELLLLTSQGEQKAILKSVSTITLNGHPHFVESFIDITERKMLESQLLQSQKMEAVGQLAAGIAHEINTPTQYVTDNIQFLENSFGSILGIVREYDALRVQLQAGQAVAEEFSALEARSREIDLEYLLEEIPLALSQTREGLDRITRIVRSMKEFAHPGLETKALLNLNQAIETTVTVARNEWKYVAEVETLFDPDLPSVYCIPGQINQVLLNILVNAAQAIAGAAEDKSDPKGKIEIRTIRKGREVEVRISDSGPGIPASIRERIFEPFFTTKEPGKGTGQGLCIAHRIIVQNHQGQLRVKSERGQGATFIIKLPVGDGESPLV